MFAVNVTIKVQNELAKKAIILALKDWSHDLFQNNGLMFRCFVDRTENQVEIFHVFRTKEEMEEVRKNKSNELLKLVKSKIEPKKIIVAVGGVFDVDSYNEKIELGADLVQLYTGLIYEGPNIVKRILNNGK